MSKGEPFVRTSPNRPCPVCGKPGWCKVGKEFCLCARVPDGAVRKCGEAGYLHKIGGAEPVVKQTPKPPDTRWDEEAKRYAAAMSGELRAKAAEMLGLPASGFDALPLLGHGKDESGKPFVTFPEVDGAGRVVGLCRRYRDRKLQMPGGGRGLTVPSWFHPAKVTEVFVVEGPTDSAAMWAAGLVAVGRPSNNGGVAYLVELFRRLPPACRVVVVGENDRKADGLWPGLDGAAAVAEGLAAGLARRPGAVAFPVGWTLCPDGEKDVRAWLTARVKPHSQSEEWAGAGKVLRDGLLAGQTFAEADSRAVRRLTAENRELRARLERVEAVMRKLAEKG